MSAPELPTVTVAEIPPGAVLLDVREPDEWEAGHAPNAVHVPMNSVPATLEHDPGEITPEATVVVTCKAGGRSAQVTAWLVANGYDAYNLQGGMQAWAQADQPMVSENGQPPEVF